MAMPDPITSADNVSHVWNPVSYVGIPEFSLTQRLTQDVNKPLDCHLQHAVLKE